MNPIKSDECIELKNIQYKSMLTGGNIICSDNKTEIISDLNILDKFLEDNKLHNQYDNWNKIDNFSKLKKLLDYTEVYVRHNELTDSESELLKTFFKDCIQNKQLTRVKDVVYDKEAKIIKDIPPLIYDKITRTFTLKNIEKSRIHTLKNLPPPKIRGTLKHKE
jgi:hypothetical protein